MVTRADVEAAAARIRPYVRRTPVIELESGAMGLEHPVTLKLEHLQHAGSFKPRGALNRVLSNPVPPSGILAASGGNHGAAVAWVGRRLGHRAEIFVPEAAPLAKVQRIRDFGAEVRLVGRSFGEALEASEARAKETGALVVHSYDQPEIVAGQGAVALEWEEQSPGLDTILVAVGGGGLAAGFLAWHEGRVRIVCVETEGCPTFARALAAGAPVDVDVSGLAADSLGARRAGDLALELARRQGVVSVLVTDDDVRAAQRALWKDLRVIAEPGGATALAALLSGAWVPEAGERVGVLVCGANTDPATVAAL